MPPCAGEVDVLGVGRQEWALFGAAVSSLTTGSKRMVEFRNFAIVSAETLCVGKNSVTATI